MEQNSFASAAVAQNEPPRSRRQEFMGGVAGVAPLILGAFPFGLIYGVLAISAGLPASLAQAMSPLVFAGSAQFIATQLLRDGAPLLIILATAAVVNLRHVLYSASMAPHVQHLNRRWQALLAYLLTDETYAVTIARYTDKRQPTKTHVHWYFLGVGLSLWVTWLTSTAIGVFLGAQIPAAWSLDFAMPLTFITIIVPALRDRAVGSASLVAGVVALLALAMPLKLGLITAILAGILVGYAVEQFFPVPRTKQQPSSVANEMKSEQ